MKKKSYEKKSNSENKMEIVTTVTKIELIVNYSIKFLNGVSISQLRFNEELIEANESNDDFFEGTITVSTQTDSFNLLITGLVESNMSLIAGLIQLSIDGRVILIYSFNKQLSNKVFLLTIADISIEAKAILKYKEYFLNEIIRLQKIRLVRHINLRYYSKLLSDANYLIDTKTEIDHYINNEKQIENTEEILFFGTTRSKTGRTELNNYYGADFDNLHLGYCKVSVPKNHYDGKIERPFKFLRFELKENSDKHIVINDIQEFEENNFFASLKQGINELETKSALIFIHGYNTTFAEAAWRTGQIAHDIPFNGCTGFFSWNSSGDFISYFSDIENADSNIKPLERFIEDILLKTGVENLHFIAHSMGNRILTNALLNLSLKRSALNNLKSINQIVLAAPDIDRNVFNKNILPEFVKIGNRRTLYSSDKDRALKISKLIRRNKIRIGEAGKRIYIADGLDTVDASNVMSEGNHHSYMFEAKELLYDLSLLLNDGFAPIKRRLKEKRYQSSKYWFFRK